MEGNTEAVKVLLDHGADVNDVDVRNEINAGTTF